MDASVYTLIGVCIGALPGLVSTWVTKRSEERRQFRKLAVRAAIEKFKIENDLSLEVLKATGENSPIAPFDGYLIHTMRLMEIAQDTSLSTEQVVTKITELGEFSKAAGCAMKTKQEPKAE